MTNYHFIEDTRILFYASLSLRMVQVINRLLEGGELVASDREVAARCIRFVELARNGQEIVYGRAKAMIPDAESVEIFGFAIDVLDRTDVEDRQRDEYSREHLLETQEILEYIANGTISAARDRPRLLQTRDFFSKAGSVLLEEIASHNDGDQATPHDH